MVEDSDPVFTKDHNGISISLENTVMKKVVFCFLSILLVLDGTLLLY